MSADWVPFHRRLAKGPKKSIPRGIRFVLLELSLEARNTHGIIDLPVDWETLDALHDLLGGDRREIRKALDIFTFRDSSGVAAIEIVKDVLRHRCVITKWAEWAGPKSGAQRQADYIKNKQLQESVRHYAVTAVTPTLHNSTEQNTTEERGDESQALPPKPKVVRGAKLPDDWKPSETDRAFALKRGWSEGKVTAEAERFRAHHEHKGTVSKSWPASWRTWVLNSDRFEQPTSSVFRRAPVVQPVAAEGEYDWSKGAAK